MYIDFVAYFFKIGSNILITLMCSVIKIPKELL